MKQLTTKEIFRAIEAHNSLADITGEKNQNIIIYIDDCKVYEGQDYKKFCKKIREEYIPRFADAVLNAVFETRSTKIHDQFGGEFKVDFFVYEE